MTLVNQIKGNMTGMIAVLLVIFLSATLAAQQPSVPDLISPVGGTPINDDTPTFVWSDTGSIPADSFTIQYPIL